MLEADSYRQAIWFGQRETKRHKLASVQTAGLTTCRRQLPDRNIKLYHSAFGRKYSFQRERREGTGGGGSRPRSRKGQGERGAEVRTEHVAIKSCSTFQGKNGCIHPLPPTQLCLPLPPETQAGYTNYRR